MLKVAAGTCGKGCRIDTGLRSPCWGIVELRLLTSCAMPVTLAGCISRLALCLQPQSSVLMKAKLDTDQAEPASQICLTYDPEIPYEVLQNHFAECRTLRCASQNSPRSVQKSILSHPAGPSSPSSPSLPVDQPFSFWEVMVNSSLDQEGRGIFGPLASGDQNTWSR